jgi:hypothetical protein
MKTDIRYDGTSYAVYVNGERIVDFARYADAERCLFALIKVSRLTAPSH